jgi:hypothetical protein
MPDYGFASGTWLDVFRMVISELETELHLLRRATLFGRVTATQLLALEAVPVSSFVLAFYDSHA